MLPPFCCCFGCHILFLLLFVPIFINNQTPTQPTNLFCIMAQIRRRCLTLNDHTLINFSLHPQSFPSALFFFFSFFIYSGVQDDSDSYTSPHIYFIRRPLSLLFLPFFFFYVCAALSNGLCIKLHNKVICTLFPGSLFRSSL